MSAIQQLKDFHNWVKMQQMSKYIVFNQQGIDLCSGNGGDLPKFCHLYPQSLVCIDKERKHLHEAQHNRFPKLAMRENIRHIEWLEGDMTNPTTFVQLTKNCPLLSRPGTIDFVNMQFALTYFMKDVTTLTNLVTWISTLLKPGGYWIGTASDGHETLQLLQSNSVFENTCGRIELLEPVVKQEKRIKSTIANDPVDNNNTKPNDQQIGFGKPVHSELRSSILGRTGVDEYLVDFQQVDKVASWCGLTLIHSKLFRDWYQEYNKSDLTEDQMAFTFVNRSFVFQKTRI